MWEIGHLAVRVAVVGVLDLRPFAKEGIRLVEEQDGVGSVGFVEDRGEVLLRFADVLADDVRKVDPVAFHAQVGIDDPRRHRLAHAFCPVVVSRESFVDYRVPGFVSTTCMTHFLFGWISFGKSYPALDLSLTLARRRAHLIPPAAS